MLPLALAICAVLHLPARAAEDTAPVAPQTQADADEPLTPALDELLESTRRNVRSTAEWLARAVDGKFGDKSFDEGGKVGNGRVDLAFHKRQGAPRELALRFNASFRLPNLEHRVHMFIGNDDSRDVVTDNPQSFSQQQRLIESRAPDNAFFAGIKVPLLEFFEFRLGVHGPFNPFAQASFERSWAPTEADVFEFRETLFMTPDDHFGSTTVGSYALALSPTLAVRWVNSATITRVTKRFDWNSSLGAYRAFGGQRLLSVEALFSGFQGSGVGVSEYGLQTRWEQPIYRTWVLAELAIGHFWPRKDALSERARVWGAGVTLKMKF